jgi:transposase-like protein
MVEPMKKTVSSALEEEKEGARRVADLSSSSAGATPARGADSEVLEKATRRRFTYKYKLSILEQADRCEKPGQLGALLRREGLYSSSLNTWRRQRESGTLKALTPRKRGRKPDPQAQQNRRVSELEREVQQLRHKLMQAETIIDVQKKVSSLLGIPLSKPHSDGNT